MKLFVLCASSRHRDTLEAVAKLIDSLPKLQRIALRDNPVSTPFVETHALLLLNLTRVRSMEDCLVVVDVPILAEERLASMVEGGAARVRRRSADRVLNTQVWRVPSHSCVGHMEQYCVHMMPLCLILPFPIPPSLSHTHPTHTHPHAPYACNRLKCNERTVAWCC